MANKPILFSGPMVRAILEGRKNRTRRLIKPPVPLVGQNGGEFLEVVPTKLACGFGFDWRYRLDNPEFRKPRYRKGDLLWVCEAWRTHIGYDKFPPRHIPDNSRIEYLADGQELESGRYRHARFMCKWMARLWVRVTEDPYPERVRDITEAEAIREGVESAPCLASECTSERHLSQQFTYRAGFFRIWKELHGPDSWERDWDWRYAFERTEAPHG